MPMTMGNLWSEFTAKYSVDALKASGMAYARTVLAGGRLAGKMGRGTLRFTAGRMGQLGGGGVLGASMGNYGGASRMLLNRKSMFTGSLINAGVGGVMGGMYDNNDRMGGAMRGAALGVAGGIGGRFGAAGMLKYAEGAPQFRSVLQGGLGRYGRLRGGMNRLGRRVS